MDAPSRALDQTWRAGGLHVVTLVLATSAFAPGESIPRRFTCDGADVSPALAWSGAPEGTRSFALVVEDPDAPSGLFTHWLQWDMGASLSSLDEDEASGTAGRNSFGRVGYDGPCPPRGRGPHRYFFRLYALDVAALGPARGADRAAVMAALEGHVLATAEVIGVYGR